MAALAVYIFEVHTSQRMPFAAPKRPDMVLGPRHEEGARGAGCAVLFCVCKIALRYFLTLQEQRLALAALAALAAEEQLEREPTASPRPSRRPRAEPRYELPPGRKAAAARAASRTSLRLRHLPKPRDAHCCLQEARIASEVRGEIVHMPYTSWSKTSYGDVRSEKHFSVFSVLLWLSGV